MSVLAIDAGTTGVTVVVVTGDGRIAARGSAGFGLHVPRPGWVEQGPDEVWQATLEATRQVLATTDRDDLQAIGVTNQRQTILLWDRETLGAPRRAIARQDRRTADLCDRLREEGHEGRVAELTGLRLDPGFPGTRLRWLAENEPRAWGLVEEGRYAVGTVESYLIARMTRGLHHVSDVSNACRTLLFDLARGDWSDELCRLFGVPRDALPDLVPSWGEAAVSDPKAFAGLELPIAGIAGDQPAALVGQACFGAGESQCSYGAGWHVLTHTGTTLPRSDAGLLPTAAWRSPDGELSYALEAASSGDPHARDPVPGTTRGTAPASRGRADLERVACEVRDVLEAMPARGETLRVGGSGAADDLLCQLQADRLGIAVERPQVLETTALGAAFLAGLGTGVWESTDALRETWARERRFEPGGDRSAADAAYAGSADPVHRSQGRTKGS